MGLELVYGEGKFVRGKVCQTEVHDHCGPLLPDVHQQASRREEASLSGPTIRRPSENPAFYQPYRHSLISEG
jgi:hypothetical protein